MTKPIISLANEGTARLLDCSGLLYLTMTPPIGDDVTHQTHRVVVDGSNVFFP